MRADPQEACDEVGGSLDGLGCGSRRRDAHRDESAIPAAQRLGDELRPDLGSNFFASYRASDATTRWRGAELRDASSIALLCGTPIAVRANVRVSKRTKAQHTGHKGRQSRDKRIWPS